MQSSCDSRASTVTRLVITFTVAPLHLLLLQFSALALAGKYGPKQNNTHKFHKSNAPGRNWKRLATDQHLDLVHQNDRLYAITNWRRQLWAWISVTKRNCLEPYRAYNQSSCVFIYHHFFFNFCILF